jgi:hypothetical protein
MFINFLTGHQVIPTIIEWYLDEITSELSENLY